ncbi:MAG: HDOD domain-containing protein [Methylococcaceae bacterium]|nr:HDOD domain-containing protein [Methylococcaceae bacterium]
MNTEPTSLAGWTQRLHEEEMPIFSNTACQTQSVLADNRKGAIDLASVIMQDPNLTAKLLKMSNSSYYNPSNQKMVTVSRSIVLLGSTVISEITLACSFFEAILSDKNKLKANEEIASAIHAAVQAKSLAILSKDNSPEEVFIAALLHNLGDIAFWCFSGKQGESILAQIQAGKTQKEAERMVLGFHLSTLSIELCRSFQLNGLIRESINNISNDRTHLVTLSHAVSQASKQGWESESMHQCLTELAQISTLPIKALKETLQKNTAIAVKIAQQFGAHDASTFIQKNVHSKESTLENTEQAVLKIDTKQLQFQILQDISNLLCEKIDLNLLFETVVEGLHRGLGMDRSCFMLATPNKDKLNEKFSFGWNKEGIHQKISFALSANPPNLFFYVSQSNQALWATPTEHERYYTPHIINTLGNIECFLLPLYTENKFIGVIYADRAISHNALTQDDFNTAKHFAQQATVGLNLYRINK